MEEPRAVVYTVDTFSLPLRPSSYVDTLPQNWDDVFVAFDGEGCRMYEVASCDSCGWEGSALDLKDGPDTLDGICPKCGSPDTWLGPLEEEK